jgi:hypothetical protein
MAAIVFHAASRASAIARLFRGSAGEHHFRHPSRGERNIPEDDSRWALAD